MVLRKIVLNATWVYFDKFGFVLAEKPIQNMISALTILMIIYSKDAKTNSQLCLYRRS